MKETFGDALFVPQPEERPPWQFKSPEELKNKIIISDTPPRDPLQKQVIFSFPTTLSFYASSHAG